MTVAYPGFPEAPEQVKSVRTVRFERWPNSTVRNPNPEADAVGMQFEVVPDLGNGFPGIVGKATIRGALYAIGLSAHDLQWALSEVEREIDAARARQAVR